MRKYRQAQGSCRALSVNHVASVWECVRSEALGSMLCTEAPKRPLRTGPREQQQTQRKVSGQNRPLHMDMSQQQLLLLGSVLTQNKSKWS